MRADDAGQQRWMSIGVLAALALEGVERMRQGVAAAAEAFRVVGP